MSYIQRELEKLAQALREPNLTDEYDQFYAAQQALSWALEPEGFKRPYDMITGTPGDSADCSARGHRAQS